MNWIKLEEDEVCPNCGSQLEALVNDKGIVDSERCSKGCFVYKVKFSENEKKFSV
jgi:hypothetical protein